MANTTNYNWETPDDTDLVKDGAAAIRTLGSSIDTTTKALNPETTLGDIAYRSSTANTNTRLAIGSTGQVLTVAGGVPSWATPTTGDIEGVTAGTGISGGGTSGTVTITNSMATAIDAKGDLVVGTGADTFARLAVGTNGHTLVADSAEATGLKWQAPASSGFVGVKLSKSGSQSLTNNTASKITWDTEDYDTDGFHSTSSNTSRITIPSGKAGKYRITATGSFADNATGQRYFAFYKNGTLILVFSRLGGYSNFDTAACGSIDVNLAENDYIELEAFQNSGGALIFGGTTFSDFSAQFLGA